MRVGLETGLALQSDVDQQGYSEVLAQQRRSKAGFRLREPVLLTAHGHLGDLGLLEDLAPEVLASGQGGDLCVGQVGERFDGRHARDELAEDDEVLRVAGHELVHEVLQDDPERRLHGHPSTVHVAGKGREALQPHGDAGSVLFGLGSVRAERVEDRVRHDVVTEVRQVPARFDDGNDEVVVALHLVESDPKDDGRVRVGDAGESLAELLDILGRQSAQERLDIAFRLGFANREGRVPTVVHVFPLAVDLEASLDREEGEDLPHFECRRRIVFEEGDGRNEVRAEEIQPVCAARMIARIRLRKVIAQG